MLKISSKAEFFRLKFSKKFMHILSLCLYFILIHVYTCIQIQIIYKRHLSYILLKVLVFLIGYQIVISNKKQKNIKTLKRSKTAHFCMDFLFYCVNNKPNKQLTSLLLLPVRKHIFTAAISLLYVLLQF